MPAEVDMSPEAVARRMRTLASLYRLARSLARARIVGPVEPAATGEQAERGDDGGSGGG
ncbi:MAG: hypothetical protein KA297_14405 [Kofleriaceae bacterium]|nr:hypothetical protein [Kofleriaceae bacterium]MBP6840111.1 hypothetical protein [Kofleriaceae bacterium]